MWESPGVPDRPGFDTTARSGWQFHAMLATHLIRLGFRRYSTYRAATWAGVFTNLVWGVLLTSVIDALFAVRDVGAEVSGYTRGELITQVWLAQGLLAAMSIWGYTDITERITSGDVVIDLYRPTNFRTYWMWVDYGRFFFQVLGRGIPPVVLGVVLFDARLPHHLWTWPLFACALILANAVSFGMRFLTGCAGFWVLDATGLNRLAQISWTVLSGQAVSLALWPDGAERVARLLPPAALFQGPIDVFLERRGTGPADLGAAWVIGLQAIWALALAAAGARVLAAGRRRLVVQGG